VDPTLNQDRPRAVLIHDRPTMEDRAPTGNHALSDDPTAAHALPEMSTDMESGEEAPAPILESEAPLTARPSPVWEEDTDRVRRAPANPMRTRPTPDDAFDRADTLITDLPTLSPKRKPGSGTRLIPLNAAVHSLPRAAVEGTVRVFQTARQSQTMRHVFSRFPFLARLDRALRDVFGPTADALMMRPWLLWAFAVGFLVSFIFLIVLVSTSGNVASLDRIKAGEADQVLEALESIPASERTGKHELLRGHALVKLDREDDAIAAYRRALDKGRVDARALGVIVERLDHEKCPVEVDMLVNWPKKKRVEKRLKEKVKYGAYYERNHARAILDERGFASDWDVVALAIKDLDEAPQCELREKALQVLKSKGAKDEAAREAVLSAQKREDSGCMDGMFRKMLPHLYGK